MIKQNDLYILMQSFKKFDRLSIPCPDGIKGCAVAHSKLTKDKSIIDYNNNIDFMTKRVIEEVYG